VWYCDLNMFNFFRVQLDKLEHFNCEGCAKISDDAFKYLLLSCRNNQHSYCLDNMNKDKICVNFFDNLETCKIMSNANNGGDNSIEEIDHKDERVLDKSSINSLKYINLSGCWLITDFGLG